MLSLVIFPILILIYFNIWVGIFWWEIWKRPEWDVSFKEKIIATQLTGILVIAINYIVIEFCCWFWGAGY